MDYHNFKNKEGRNEGDEHEQMDRVGKHDGRCQEMSKNILNLIYKIHPNNQQSNILNCYICDKNLSSSLHIYTFKRINSPTNLNSTI